MAILLIILSYMCLVARVLSFVLVLRLISCLLAQHVVFSLVMVNVKKDIIVMIMLLKNYVSCRVFFLEHIPFLSISHMSYQASKIDLIYIDPFLHDHPSTRSIDVSSSQRSPIAIEDVSPPLAVILAVVIADPLSQCYPHGIRKSTQLSDYVYSFFSSSFTLFLVSLHNLCEPTSYREAVLDLKW